ncbi:universal stress protein [Halopseudomonas nanhaiensis]|uniref:universal stress protein n=1 Tax=Halopseudomonas nanhaiensis TaxID=2830842 RepID=UPI001CBB6563|nr:universal stress protein [Halopseudomonas nanhaiensis]UAW98658.1 universal stress protein [Halopseudomonas nanhaiensis]
MTDTTVIGCIDGSDSSATVCDYATWASIRLQAPLVLLHALDHEEFQTPRDLSGNIGLGSREHLLVELAELDARRSKLMLEQGRLMLEAAGERARSNGASQPLLRQRHGGFVETVRDLEGETRLLVIGRQGEEGDSMGQHVGTHLESIIRTLHRPILVTTRQFVKPRSVMLAFDNGPSTRKGIEMIARSPLFQGMTVHLVMVGPDTNDAWESVHAARAQLERAGFDVIAAIRSGDVENTLLDYEEEQGVDMIVMGAYGHSRIRQFFVGSTTTNLLSRTLRPLLLIR